METFKTYYLKESISEIDWEHPIKYFGTPYQQALIAEYKDKDEKYGWGNFTVKIVIDPVGYGEGNPQAVRQLLLKSPNWNKQLIWISAILGGEHLKLGNKKYFYKQILDTPENRIKAEKRYKEIIYAMMKVSNKRPKESEEYIKNIVERPI